MALWRVCFVCLFTAKFEVAFGWGVVPVPNIMKGSWVMTDSAGDDKWHGDEYTQFNDGSFRGWGDYDGSHYNYTGQYTQISCEHLPDDHLVVSVQYWSVDDIANSPDTAKLRCAYYVYDSNSPNAPSADKTYVFDDAHQYEVSDLRNGMPGACPTTGLSDILNGDEPKITWMKDQVTKHDTPRYGCTHDCPSVPVQCDATVTTCGQNKRAYKNAGCCKQPERLFSPN